MQGGRGRNTSQLRGILRRDMAQVRLEEFEAEWGKRYPAIGQAWRRAWEHVVPFFAFAPGIRKMIYTTNAVEALHRSLRKIIKTRSSSASDFQEQRDDLGNRHHGKVDHRLVRSFAVKPRAFGTPLRGLGA